MVEPAQGGGGAFIEQYVNHQLIHELEDIA
jgi:hypothetical protein